MARAGARDAGAAIRGFRVQRANEREADLLSARHQWTDPWGGAESGERCDKCAGEGVARHECWSCLLTAPEPSCPACAGALRWQARCPVCRGGGLIDGAPRRGVSVFPKVEGLYRYMLAHDADLDGCVVVELIGAPAADPDFDADEGALLILPSRICARHPLDTALMDRVQVGVRG